MTLKLYAHPFSSYCQKAITAFYEKDVAFEQVMLDGSEPVASAFAALWPIGKFPALADGERLVFDATSIIEYLDVEFPATPLIPAGPHTACEVRMWDRFFDNYINYPQQRLVYAAIGRANISAPSSTRVMPASTGQPNMAARASAISKRSPSTPRK